MRKFVTIILLGGLSFISSAQSCIPEYIFFNTQGQVDSFHINYPGCVEIEGDVIISGYDITNLFGLTVLTSIGGDLRIEGNPSLVRLNGLDNISFIGGELNIEENESLFNLDGLSNLVHINGSLIIKENPSLINLSGLDNLDTIGVDLNIGCSGYSWTGNPLLNNLMGLYSLSSIGNSLRICKNHGLTDLSGIENLTSVEYIYISSNDNLLSLTGLQGVSNVNGNISIVSNDLLYSLSGLNNLTTAGGLALVALSSLNDLGGLERLTTVDNDMTISQNISLEGITSLDSLTYIGGELTIYHNHDLVDLTGLDNLTEIGAGLEIQSNHSLSNIDALSLIVSIGGDLIITNNSLLNSLIGLSGVTSIDGNLSIRSMSNITSLAGIESINASSIEDLNISWLYSLTDCALPNICEYLADPNGIVDIYRNGNSCNNPSQIANGCGFTISCLPYGNYHFIFQSEVDNFPTNYPGCTDLEGSLYIHGGWGGGTGDYTNLDGLSAITSIDGSLAVHGAYYLTNLKGIENIDATSITDLWIYGSPYLSECEVQSICDYLANPNGEVYITDNADGCNSPEEVLGACESVIVQEQYFESHFNIFPNPASNYLFIDNPSNYEIGKILIYNTIGQIIYSQDYKGPIIHISGLDQGIYILEIIADDLKKRMKFIVKN